MKYDDFESHMCHTRGAAGVEPTQMEFPKRNEIENLAGPRLPSGPTTGLYMRVAYFPFIYLCHDMV